MKTKVATLVSENKVNTNNIVYGDVSFVDGKCVLNTKKIEVDALVAWFYKNGVSSIFTKENCEDIKLFNCFEKVSDNSILLCNK